MQQDLDSLFDINHDEMNEMHASYEKETNHGIDKSAQSIWNHKIQLELENFGKYSSNRTVLPGFAMAAYAALITGSFIAAFAYLIYSAKRFFTATYSFESGTEGLARIFLKKVL